MARMAKLNQQITDTQNAIQAIDAKLSSGAPTMAPGATPGGPAAPAPRITDSPQVVARQPLQLNSAATPPPSGDLLYSEWTARSQRLKKYDLSTQEFQDYLKYYNDSDLASNAQFYLGEIAFAQEVTTRAPLTNTARSSTNIPRASNLRRHTLKKGLALVALGQKASGIRELRVVVQRYPGTDEERRARAKLKDLGVTS